MNRLDVEFYEGVFDAAGQEVDYKERFQNEVTNVVLTVDDEGQPPPIDIRRQLIDVLTTAYVQATGETPCGIQVQRMGNWLLLEVLTDSHPDKVTTTEYPIMTKRQLKTRYYRENASDSIEDTATEQKYLGGKKQSNYIRSE